MKAKNLLEKIAKGIVSSAYESAKEIASINEEDISLEFIKRMKNRLKRLENYNLQNRNQTFEYMGDEFLARDESAFALYFYQKVNSCKANDLKAIMLGQKFENANYDMTDLLKYLEP